MAESQRSRAFVWLAASSALLVLLASGVAISRFGDSDDGGNVASAPENRSATSGDAGSEGGSGSGPADSGAVGTPGSGDAVGGTSGSSGPGAVTGTAGRDRATASDAGSQGSTAAENPSRTTGSGSGAPSGSGQGGSQTGPQGDGSQSGGSQGGDAQGGGSQGSGQESPPAPSQSPPEDRRTVAASASVGEGATGGVVALGVEGASLDADVTVGTNQLVGNHPPSDGTGVTFGGQFFDPPPGAPALSG